MTRWVVAVGVAVTVTTFCLSGHATAGAVAGVAGLWLASLGGRRLDRDRTFSTEERAVILDRAAGACESCGRMMHYESECPLENGCGVDYNADHVIPWSRGGATDLTNSQALCRTCNIHKSDR